MAEWREPGSPHDSTDACSTYVPPPGAQTYEFPCTTCRRPSADHDAQPCPDCGVRCTWSEEQEAWMHERSVPDCFLSQGES